MGGQAVMFGPICSMSVFWEVIIVCRSLAGLHVHCTYYILHVHSTCYVHTSSSPSRMELVGS